MWGHISSSELSEDSGPLASQVTRKRSLMYSKESADTQTA